VLLSAHNRRRNMFDGKDEKKEERKRDWARRPLSKKPLLDRASEWMDIKNRKAHGFSLLVS